MCGITGSIKLGKKPNISEDTLREMTDSMYHRGPDDKGYHISDPYMIGMRRLSIIDVHNGKQPIYNDDKSIVIILNGEIYNYKELRKKLENIGFQFKTKTDTEVILRMYEQYGIKSIEMIKGMFAFCLIDMKNDITWIARDRFGIKPLIYYLDDEKFIFGSTIDAVKKSFDVCPEFDDYSVYLYMMMSYIPTPRTIYKNIYKLKPGNQIVINKKQVEISEYWNADMFDQTSELFNKDIFYEHMKDIVDSHLISEKPLGTFLSGGLDSSVITKMYADNNDKRFNTYTAEFEGKDNQDLYYANNLAKDIKTNHSVISLNSENFLNYIDELIHYLDEPLYDSSMAASYALSKAAKKDGITALLAGTGADEILGGFKRYYYNIKGKVADFFSVNKVLLYIISKISNKFAHKLFRVKFKNLGYIVNFSSINQSIYAKLSKNVDLSKLDEILEDYLNIQGGKKGFTINKLKTDIKSYLIDNELNILDKTTMASSIEGRTPYLDNTLIEYLFKLKYESYLSDNYRQSKKALRNMSKDIGLNDIAERTKAGFNQPLESIFKNLENISKIKKSFAEAKLFLEQFLDYDYLLVLVNNINHYKCYENIFNIYVLSKWYSTSFQK
jgi:asparagine synthase (glutamine-hydrolysing)